ncbi:hypothetical protein [Acidovorax sp. SUPP2825]|uniref:hypothetical protein n=1 Tax=Acidovorax sp. SUPP2825 TaxID=2920879 RepID=UPI0023DE33D2|nr:hypothetical protein [Acidovorax sp. SUPP2825]GKS97321.1 hypothetical protein AVAK2825_22320 [Acidovorax sp. SUPP2825]
MNHTNTHAANFINRMNSEAQALRQLAQAFDEAVEIFGKRELASALCSTTEMASQQ